MKKLVAALRESAEAASRVMLEQLGVKRDSNVFKQFELHATSKATTLAAMRVSTPVDNFVDLATQRINNKPRLLIGVLQRMTESQRGAIVRHLTVNKNLFFFI